MSISPINGSKVFLALLDLEKPSRAVDVTDYLAGETGADSRRISSAVRYELDQLVRMGCIAFINGLYIVIRDEKTIHRRLNMVTEQRRFEKPEPEVEQPKKIDGYVSFPNIPPQIRRESPLTNHI